MDYLNQVTALTEKALQAIGVSLGYDESYFDEICTETMAFYQLLHYPPQPADADPLQRGIGAHRDFGVITLLLQGMSPGWRCGTRSRSHITLCHQSRGHMWCT